MIPITTGLFRPALLLFVLLNIPSAKAGLKSVELVYDKTAVFKGASPLFSIKVTKSSGKTFLSTDEYAKYPCVDFTIKVSNGIETLDPSQKYFALKIPENFEPDSITLEMRLSYSSSPKMYTIKIPVYNAIDHVESLHLFMERDSVFTDKPIAYKIFADLEENEGIEIKNRKIAFDDIDITVLKGGIYDSDNARIIPIQRPTCDSSLVVRVALKNRPEIYTDEVFRINRSAQNFSFSGFDGDRGKNGMAGEDGANAATITFFLKLGIHPCSQDSVLILDSDLKLNKRPLYFSLNDVNIILDVNGGNGGQGGTGHDGAYGQNGWSGLGYGGNGGDGGDGGDGGNGGNGGNGGFVKIVYTSETQKYISKILVHVSGGQPGYAGRYGRYGKKGLAGFGTDGNGVMGRNGYDGRDGESGTKGLDGKVEFILDGDYLGEIIQ